MSSTSQETEGAERRERIPQSERRARTRKRVLDATIECLADIGYARTTTTEVARRAGVSRGAQQHYFPSKDDLVAAAVEHAFEERLSIFASAARPPAPLSDDDVVGAAIDMVWSMFEEPVALAWIELVVAARTNPELQTRIREVGGRMHDAIETQFEALFPTPSDDVVYPVATKLAFAAFDGLVLQRIAGFDDDWGRAEAAVEALKAMFRSRLAP